LSVTAFERILLYQIFTITNYKTENSDNSAKIL
jgi:hypothetical protein